MSFYMGQACSLVITPVSRRLTISLYKGQADLLPTYCLLPTIYPLRTYHLPTAHLLLAYHLLL